MNYKICSYRDIINNTYGVNDWKDYQISIIDSIIKDTDLHIWVEDTVGKTGPTLEHLQKISNYISTLPEDSNVLIHCSAGISRSTGVLFYLLMCEGKSYIDAYKEMLAIRPQAYPNCQIIEICDNLFKCNGELIKLDKEYKAI